MEQCSFLFGLFVAWKADIFIHECGVAGSDALLNTVDYSSMRNPVPIAGDPVHRVSSQVEQEDQQSFAPTEGHLVVGTS